MIDLGEANPIDQMIATFREGITGEAESRRARDLGAVSATPQVPSAQDSAELRAALFDPLVAALGSRKRLLLAPDGDLSRLPFEVLPTGDDRRLIDEYRISYLGAGRDILRLRAATSGQPADPLVLADPDFDLGGKAVAAAHSSAGVVPDPSALQSKTGFRSRLLGRADVAPASPAPPAPEPARTAPATGRQSRDLDLRTLHFERLRGTRVEGERIADMLGVRAWLEETALEARVKACRSPRILHLATHGFFLPDQKRDPNEEQGALGAVGRAASAQLGRMAGIRLENPLLRSGLALAGANTRGRGGSLPPEAEDGLLTAEDVSGLNLLDTELVVLSACETGLGEVRTGEGVFGLRRAFVLAGARTLVMSLWKVPDEQTEELMEEFYRRLLAGECRSEALRGAQLAIRTMYRDPGYWGAFICQGDFGPLRKEGESTPAD